MNVRQYIYNESDNSSSKIISMKYRVLPDNNSHWYHRDIEHNVAGIPIVRMYLHETKQLYKDIYLNGVKSDLVLINKLDCESLECVNNDIKICEITSNSNENWITIHATSVGSYKISSNITGTLDKSAYSINDSEIIIIVEEEPKIIALKWNCVEPLILNSLDPIDITLPCHAAGLYGDRRQTRHNL